ncbi:MAG: amidohydrolase family protein [Candidatus Nomurabacteria bacterium]|nr:amidohydrolase family protein [Candidatus Nomurabacteria bacterium]
MSLVNKWLEQKYLKTYPDIIRALNGEILCDWEIKNATVVDVFTLTTFRANVWTKGAFIVLVQPLDSLSCKDLFRHSMRAEKEYDAEGMYILPGYVDTHMHIESVEVTPSEFGWAAAKTGTTTVFTDCHEAVNVGGIEAFLYMLEDSEKSPIRQFMLAPSCVPAAEGLELAGAEWYAEDIRKIYAIDNPRIVGTAEVMDYLGIVTGDKRMRDILAVTRELGGYAQGHAHDMFERALASLRLQGIQGNHEPIDPESVLAAMRAGMYIDLSIVSSLGDSSKELKVLAADEHFSKIGSFDKLTFCTDDRNVAALLDGGHINLAVKRFVEAMWPHWKNSNGYRADEKLVCEAIRIATLNAWREYGVTDHAGAIAPGYLADFQLVPDSDVLPDEINETNGLPSVVFVDGEMLAPPARRKPKKQRLLEIEATNTVKLKPITADQLKIAAPKWAGDEVTVRVLDYSENPIINTATEMTLPVVNGYLSLDGHDDLSVIVVFHRHGRSDNVGYGIAKGLSLKDGALATTVAHDGHNLVVVYKPDAINLAVDAVNELINIHGGITYHATNGKVYTKPLPVFGLMSDKPAEEVARAIKSFEEGFRKHNGPNSNPMLAAILSLTVAPHYRVTDLGLIDALKKEIISLFVR